MRTTPFLTVSRLLPGVSRFTFSGDRRSLALFSKEFIVESPILVAKSRKHSVLSLLLNILVFTVCIIVIVATVLVSALYVVIELWFPAPSHYLR